jgi:hypothetical protein
MTKRLEDAVNRAAFLTDAQQDTLAVLMQAEMGAAGGLEKVRPKPGSALDGLFQQVSREFKAGLNDPPEAEVVPPKE